MDIGKSFTYMFEDPNWIAKVAIGGGILLVGALFSWVLAIPLIAASAVVLGYSLAVTRNVAEGVANPLPEWSDFGALLIRGLTALVGLLVWFLPVILLVCCLVIVNGVVAGATSGSSSDSARSVSGVVALLATCLSCIIAIVSIAISLLIYAPLTRFALNGQLNTFWDFSGNLKFIQANMGNYIFAVLLGPIAANFLASFGIIACVIGVFFTSFWAYLVSAHLFGQVARGAPAAAAMMPQPGVL